MLQAGKNITQKNDPLKKITPEYLFHAVKNPPAEVASTIRQLRLLRNIDLQRYRELKRGLPYVVTGIFHPPVRLIANFAWANHFMLDIDHLSEKELTPEQLKERLAADQRVLLMFTSPGEDGVKILFQLSEKIYDAGRFSLFYRVFVSKFSRQYNIEQVADTRTSDVTRACFISHDPLARFNPDALPVNPDEFIDFDNTLEIKQTRAELKTDEKEYREKHPEEKTETLTPSALEKIKATLNPNFRPREKQIYVPDEIENITQKVIDDMAGLGIATTETVKIHYGKKFKFALESRKAEINLFYGKRGYSVVISPRTGTDRELNEVCARILSEWFT